MSVLYTFTANLLAETTAVFSMPKIGETVRARSKALFKVGGKGVNVSMAAKMLGANTVAAIFPAGETGNRCKKYLDGKIEYFAVGLRGQTREGLVCIDEKSGRETTFLGEDIPVDGHSFDKMAEFLQKKISADDIFAFCGSFPGWERQYADRLFEICKSAGAKICIDTYGEPLEDFSKKEIDLLKVNCAEFLALFKSPGEAFDGNFESAVAKFETPAKILAVTDGPRPAIFRAGGKIFNISPPRVDEISATGCGDIMLATFAVNAFMRGKSARESAEEAIRAASKAASSRDRMRKF